MIDKKMIKCLGVIISFITIGILLLAILYNDSFYSSVIYLTSLSVFMWFFYLDGDKEREHIQYALFGIGVLLIVFGLGYTFWRLK